MLMLLDVLAFFSSDSNIGDGNSSPLQRPSRLLKPDKDYVSVGIVIGKSWV